MGVIGAVLKETPSIVTPTGVLGLSFLDEATAINQEVARLEERACAPAPSTTPSMW